MGDARAVVVLNLWANVPVVHLPRPGHFRRMETADGWHRTETRPACGILLDVIEWQDRPAPWWSEVRLEHRRGTWLRRDHAETIGRLCERCAPHDA